MDIDLETKPVEFLEELLQLLLKKVSKRLKGQRM